MIRYTQDFVFKKDEQISVSFHRAHTEEIHTHDFVELVYITGGTGYQYIDGKKYSVMRGDALFINYNHTHAFTTEKGMEYYNIYLNPSFLSRELINANNAMQMLSLTAFEDFRETVGEDSPVVRFSGNELFEIENCLSAMEWECKSKKSGSETILKSYLNIFLTYMFRKMEMLGGETGGFRSNQIFEFMRYIEENCTSKLSLSDLAEKSFYNPSYFSRIFKEYSGTTVTEFIHEKRIAQASSLLVTTNNSVEEICLDVGYTNKTLFYKKFREKTGVSPAAFRKKSKLNGKY